MDTVGKEKALLSLGLLVAFLIICNLVFVYSNGWYRLVWQVFGFGGLVLIGKVGGLSLADIGLSKSHLLAGLKWGLIVAAIILFGLIIAYFVNPNLFKDTRYHHSLPAVIYSALVIIPLKTVIFEEIAFRGIMAALLKGAGANLVAIIVVSSLLFGLWHILSAPKSDALAIGNFSSPLIIFGVLLITSLGGAFFYFLRYHSDSLIAPIIAHWAINGFSIVLASISWLHRS